MTWVAGADGCKMGWFRAARESATGELCFDAVTDAGELVSREPRPAVLAVDIPIGLPEAGARDCDRLARQRLGWPRRSSVFPAPVRAAVAAQTRAEASRLTAARDGRRVGSQAWGLYPKIDAVDKWLSGDRKLRSLVREAHPELCFWAWNQGRPMTSSKKTRAGRQERLRLAEAWLGARVLERARGRLLRREVADDDILDALAVLWTAMRVHEGTARRLPESPPLDATGLRMEIVY